MSNKSDDRSTWAETIYKNLCEEIRFAKKQQWQLIYYTFLLDSGTFYFSKNNNLFKYLFATAIILFLYVFMAYISFSLVSKIENSLKLNRRYLSKIKSDNNIGDLIGETKKEKEEDEGPEKDAFYIHVIQCSILGCALFFIILSLINYIW